MGAELTADSIAAYLSARHGHECVIGLCTRALAGGFGSSLARSSLDAGEALGTDVGQARVADAADADQVAHRAELLAKRQAGAELSADEQDVLDVTLVTLESVSARYDADIRALLQPAVDDITEAVAATAEALGVGMVFDYRAASESGLIVYADPATDITEQVAVRLAERAALGAHAEGCQAPHAGASKTERVADGGPSRPGTCWARACLVWG